MQMFYGDRGATNNEQLNALTKGLPSDWATKVENLYNSLARSGAHQVWFQSAEMMTTAVYLGDGPEVRAFVDAVKLVVESARSKAKAGG